MTTTQPDLAVKRLPIRLAGDDSRVICLPFLPAGHTGAQLLLDRLSDLTEDQVDHELGRVMQDFSSRHTDIRQVFSQNFQAACDLLGLQRDWSKNRRLLAGAYLTMEYAIASAALFNPSIVPDPDQSGLTKGSLRFIMSFRATGEGHVSSIVFRRGVIGRNQGFRIDPAPELISRARPKPDQTFHRDLFLRKLTELRLRPEGQELLRNLPERFNLQQLQQAIESARADRAHEPWFHDAVALILWLARSNYQLQLEPDQDISSVVFFPRGDSESRGIEDLRLVRFVDDDGSATYYGTYTAFNGRRILPMLLETADFRTVSVHTLNGAAAQNKGMALFPRRIDGHYVMCGRIDGQNLYIMVSDMPHFWESAQLLARPSQAWELSIIGNCGSPIETPEGWLLVTHGVGPMRRYCIGAMLLDLEDPTRIRGALRHPLLMPLENEREGYVPNVVYSCGSLVHRGTLFLPYAMSDLACGVATIRLDELLDHLLSSPA
ncbi:MAG: glycoside hydrolase family 130 protein [Phycisphaeraceae bacterium]|nr:glycoside hydrolase family 130 protein [Phycisphaeraceae bacterium]